MDNETPASSTPEGVPLTDFAAFEAYRAAQERGAEPEPAKEIKPAAPAAAAGKPAAAKTDPDTDPDNQQSEDDDDKDGEKPQKKSGFQRRIDKLNQKLGAKDAEIAELRRAQGGTKPPPAAEKAEPARIPGTPEKPDQATFDTYEQYVEALADWKIDQREAAKAAAEANRQTAEAWKGREAAAKAAHDDYEEVLAGAADLPISLVMHMAIVESEVGPEIAYYLANHPEEAKRISALADGAGGREMGKLEARLAGEAPAVDNSKTAETKPPRVSQTPAPPKTVRAGAEATGEPDPKDYPKWEAWRSRQPGASLRR